MSTGTGAERALRVPLTRRQVLVLGAALAMTGFFATRELTDDEAAPTPSDPLTVEQFLQLSRTLTAFGDLSDTQTADQFLIALNNDPASRETLARLWAAAEFDGSDPPTSTDELFGMGIYNDAELAALADRISNEWYSGVYSGPDGNPVVATFLTALGWRTLSYRQTGPSSCGGAFGYWSTPPAA